MIGLKVIVTKKIEDLSIANGIHLNHALALLKRCVLGQMHEKEEVITSTSIRKASES
jgi:hypothetical protein